MKKKLDLGLIAPVGIAGITMLTGVTLIANKVSANDVVDEINVTVPMSCTMSGTGQDSHNANINNGTYTPNIGTTTMHVFCNDNGGFSIYAAGYTGDEIGGTNSNKLVGTSASGNAVIESGTATTAGNPDVSNWAMKLTMTQDSGDTTTDNAFTIDSAPNVDLPSQAEQGATSASFSSYHVVPNEYTKVAHKNSGTDMTDTTGGVKLTTTYAAYISKTQPADTYSGQVIYTLVHPASAAAPVGAGKVGVTYHANGSTFAGGGTTNNVVYTAEPMYIATTPLIAKSPNVADDGTKNTAYASDVRTVAPITATGASKMKVVVQYGVSAGTGLLVVPEYWNGVGFPSTYEMISDGSNNAFNTATYIFDGDSITMYIENFAGSTPTTDYDYGFWAQVYPIYTTEQAGTEASDEFVASIAVDTGAYATTTDWYGSWYGDIDGEHYDFMNEAEVISFLSENMSTLSGTTIDLYRGLTFTEAYTRANKSQDGGYYKQQELTESMCNTIAITQNQTLKDVRDNNTYMVGRLKDGNCWMLNNLALDPTDPTTASNMNASNTNATQEAITNLLNGGSSTTGWSSWAVVDVDTGFNSYTVPMINNASKDIVVTSYGAGSGKVGIYYNYCAATVGTYCYDNNSGVDIQGTIIDAPYDLCPTNWRMPTGGSDSEYLALYNKYSTTQDATSTASLQYNLSTPLSGSYYGSSARYQGIESCWWSSTYYNNYDIYTLGVYSDNVVPYSQNDRDMGFTMRCLVGS